MGGGQSLYLPLYLPGGMHIHKNLTSVSVKETGNKQRSSPPTFKERRSQSGLWKGRTVDASSMEGWGGVQDGGGFNGQQIEWPLKALRQTQGQPAL